MNSRWFDSPLTPYGAPPRAAQRLIAVPWRHAGSIALFALAGTLVAGGASLHRGAAVAKSATTAPAPPDASERTGLRLDLDPGFAAAASADAASTTLQLADATTPASALQLDDAEALDEIDRALADAPPAAGLAGVRAPAAEGAGRGLAGAGLAAGLLLGLLVAAVRELRGQRMRSVREAQWALGAPVLGAIPTLSARARAALLAPERA